MSATIRTRLEAATIAARRRPGTILLAWLVESLFAWLAAAPWSELVGAIYGQHPDGDRAVWWAPGWIDAVDLLTRQRAAVQAVLAGTAWGLAGYFLASIVLLGAILHALSEARPRVSSALARGVSLFGRLSFLQIGQLLALLVSFGALLVFPIALFAGGDASPTREVVVVLGAGSAFLLAALWLSAMTDLGRALVSRFDLGAGRALLLTLRAPRAIVALAIATAPRAVASIGLIGFGAALSTLARSVWPIALAHQLVMLGRVALRTSVLARALRLADELHRSEAPLEAIERGDVLPVADPAPPTAAEGA